MNINGLQYGTLYSFNHRQDILEAMEGGFPTNYNDYLGLYESVTWQQCFATYFSAYEPGNFYFAFPAMPEWYIGVVEEFNREFKNIQFEILTENKIYLRERESVWGKIIEAHTYKERGKKYIPAKVPLFGINFNPEYTVDSRKYLQYVLSIFLRQISFPEKTGTFEGPGEKNPISYLLSLQNEQACLDSYRTLSANGIIVSELLLLDNIERVNYCFRDDDDAYDWVEIRQTGIMSSVIDDRHFSEYGGDPPDDDYDDYDEDGYDED
jgi:hypothetical protein